MSGVSEVEEDFIPDEAINQKYICYYVMNNGVVEEQQVVFERPNPSMMYHLKLLFIRAKVEYKAINKVFVYGGTTVNLMPYSVFKKLGKVDEDLRPHNMVLSNYEGKTSNILSVIQVNLSIRSTSRGSLFMVIRSNANCNLLLRSEWIHCIGVLPSTLHQRVSILRDDGIVENIEAGQSCYKADISKVGKKDFD